MYNLKDHEQLYAKYCAKKALNRVGSSNVSSFETTLLTHRLFIVKGVKLCIHVQDTCSVSNHIHLSIKKCTQIQYMWIYTKYGIYHMGTDDNTNELELFL